MLGRGALKDKCLFVPQAIVELFVYRGGRDGSLSTLPVGFYLTTDGPSVVLRYPLVSSLQRSFKESPAGSGNDRSPNYRSFPRITVIDPAGSVYMPSGVAAVVMFLSSEGVLQYCTRATDPTNGWLMCLASSMTR